MDMVPSRGTIALHGGPHLHGGYIALGTADHALRSTARGPCSYLTLFKNALQAGAIYLIDGTSYTLDEKGRSPVERKL